MAIEDVMYMLIFHNVYRTGDLKCISQRLGARVYSQHGGLGDDKRNIWVL